MKLFDWWHDRKSGELQMVTITLAPTGDDEDLPPLPDPLWIERLAAGLCPNCGAPNGNICCDYQERGTA